jgi:hypothetical protein
MSRKLSVHLSEAIFERLQAATQGPGVSKSRVVETALERFLDPAPSVEGVLYEHIDRMRKQLEHLADEVQIVSETVALHTRYHLTVNPPLGRSQQRDACVLGDARFKALAEQVDQRVRLSRPLMRETIEGLRTTRHAAALSESCGGSSPEARDADARHRAASFNDASPESCAAVREGGSSLRFRQRLNAFF